VTGLLVAERTGDGVLTGTGTDDEYFHALNATGVAHGDVLRRPTLNVGWQNGGHGDATDCGRRGHGIRACGIRGSDRPGDRGARGTPPNRIEMDPATWISLATGALSWSEARADHRVTASGARADLTEWLPLVRLS